MHRGCRAIYPVLSRRPPTDIFSNDPFKVQSYNFRYADRPVYPVQHYQRTPLKQPESQPFKTYYYNESFHRPQVPLKSTLATNRFSEQSRRQFLQGFNPITPLEIQGLRESSFLSQSSYVNPKPQLLRSCCNPHECLPLKRDQEGGQFGNRIPASYSFRQPTRNPSESTFLVTGKSSESHCSGCAININIGGLNSSKELNKTMRIQKTSDECLQNTDKPCGRSTTSSQILHKRPLKRCESSESFVIDKRLSKFNMQQEEHLTKRLQWERQIESEKAEEPRREALRQRDDQQSLPMRAMPLPRSTLPMASPVLGRSADDRLPGMMPCNLTRASNNSRAKKLQSCTRNLTTLSNLKPMGGYAEQEYRAEQDSHLERRSSGSSNFNASVRTVDSSFSIRNLKEHKLLNLHAPHVSHHRLNTRINNVPIRITTSQPSDNQLHFSMNRIRVDSNVGAMPAESHSRSSSRSRGGETSSAAYNVNINLYADNTHTQC